MVVEIWEGELMYVLLDGGPNDGLAFEMCGSGYAILRELRMKRPGAEAPALYVKAGRRVRLSSQHQFPAGQNHTNNNARVMKYVETVTLADAIHMAEGE